MSISAIGGAASTTAAQASQYRSASTAAAAKPAGAAPPDGKAFVSAIASALQEIGVAAAGSDSANADPAAALGDFLNELMASLQSGGAKGGAAPPGPPPGGAGGPPPPGAGGGGGMKSELASLVGSLARQSATDSDEAEDGSTSTSTSASTDTDTESVGTKLASSFGTLLGALGLDSTDSASKLGQFLQSLATRLETAGPAGNLINTSA
jgi:hypothetical protein